MKWSQINKVFARAQLHRYYPIGYSTHECFLLRTSDSIRGFVHPLVGWSASWSVRHARVENDRLVWKRAFSPLPTRPRLVLAVYPALFSTKILMLENWRELDWLSVVTDTLLILESQKWKLMEKKTDGEKIWVLFVFPSATKLEIVTI